MSVSLHILPADDASQGGDGSPTNPLRVHGPRHFDDLMETIDLGSMKHIEEVFLGPGTYWTRGPWSHEHFGSTRPIALLGSVPIADNPHAVIKLHPEAIFQTNGEARPDTLVMRLGVGFRNNQTENNWRVEDIEFDGNEQAFPSNKYVNGGLNIWGNLPIVRNLIFRNQRGHRPDENDPLHMEAFGMTLNNKHTGDSGGYDGGAIIENCTAYDDGDRHNYYSGLYPGLKNNPGSTLLPTIIRNCKVFGIGNKPSSLGFSLQGRLNYFNCQCDNVRYALYNDVDRVENCVVDGLKATRIAFCAMALRCSNKQEWRSPDKRTVTVVNSLFEFAATTEEWIGLWVDDKEKTGARVEWIEMRDVEFKGSIASPRKFNVASLDSKNLGAIIIDGKFPTGWKSNVTQGTNVQNVLLNARL